MVDSVGSGGGAFALGGLLGLIDCDAAVANSENSGMAAAAAVTVLELPPVAPLFFSAGAGCSYLVDHLSTWRYPGHAIPRFTQLRHAGTVSSHFSRLALHTRHPDRDLMWRLMVVVAVVVVVFGREPVHFCFLFGSGFGSQSASVGRFVDCRIPFAGCDFDVFGMRCCLTTFTVVVRTRGRSSDCGESRLFNLSNSLSR